MRFPESWLRSFCSPDWTSARLADALTMAGLEVEEARPHAPPFEKVVVAEVRSVRRHPDAEKLTVCEVDAGEGALRTIVCGAPNVAQGVRVPCALPGAVLPGGFAIKPVKMRGVASDGMLCSARELGLSDDHSGLMLLAADAPVGTDLRAYLSLDDTIFLLKITPNRGDCLGVYGIAREVAAISGAALAEPKFEPVAPAIDNRLPVKISAPDLCGRFSGRVIRGVDAGAATPAWMRERLERAGQRSISALVDISNYVMLELGRPTHVFDLDRIDGGLDVRWGRRGESLELLNGQTVGLDERVGVIAAGSGVESLAGIMGGERTAVTLQTRNVYVEAAFWWPQAIAGRARRYNFSTDAGHRFERGVDASTTVAHLEHITRLVLEICGGQAGPIDDLVTRLPERAPITLRPARARKVLGVDVGDDEMQAALRRLRMPVRHEGEHLVVEPPSYRFDLVIEEDLIEEVARIWGYERIPVRRPIAPLVMREVPEGRRTLSGIRHAVAARDYQEVVNFSFVDGALDARLSGRRGIGVLNPIAAQLDVMRTTLLGGLLANLRYNLNRKSERVRLFELGRVYLPEPASPAGPLAVAGVDQPWVLGLLAWGPAMEEQWASPTRQVDFFDLKGDLQALLGEDRLGFVAAAQPALHPGRSARIELDGGAIGWIGELHPALQQELGLTRPPVVAELRIEPALARPVPTYVELSRFPAVLRDLAFVVPQATTTAQLLAVIREAIAADPAAGSVKNVKLFDEYRGKGLENKEKSVAFRFWMQDTERTLNDAEVAAALAVVVRAVERAGGRLRA